MIVKLPCIRILGFDLYWSERSRTVYWTGPREGYPWLLLMDFVSIVAAEEVQSVGATA